MFERGLSGLHSAKNTAFINVQDKLPQLRIFGSQDRLEHLLNFNAIKLKLLSLGRTQR
jgi:hypothetical protein